MLDFSSAVASSIMLEWLPIGLVLVYFAIYRRSSNPLYAAILLLIALSVSIVLLFLPKELFFADLSWNWQGKLLDFIWPWIIVYGFSWLSADEVGLHLPMDKSNFILSVKLGIILVGCFTLISLTAGFPPSNIVNKDTLFYQWTMPGLSEEITVRGIYLAILNRFLGKQWKIHRVKFGWGIILVTLMFSLSHLYHYDNITHRLQWAIQTNMDYINILSISVVGVILGFIRERSGSIWPAVVFHNIINGLPILLEMLLI